MAPAAPTDPSVAMIAAMITPALFILASGSLLATVLARIGRIVEWTRKIGEAAAKRTPPGLNPNEQALLKTLRRRGELDERAIVSYYAAVVCFVLTCLLIGLSRLLGHALSEAAVVAAMGGVLLVLVGSAFMVAECRLAMRQLRREIEDIVNTA